MVQKDEKKRTEIYNNAKMEYLFEHELWASEEKKEDKGEEKWLLWQIVSM